MGMGKNVQNLWGWGGIADELIGNGWGGNHSWETRPVVTSISSVLSMTPSWSSSNTRAIFSSLLLSDTFCSFRIDSSSSIIVTTLSLQHVTACDAHCCHMGTCTAIKRSVPDCIKPSFVIFDIWALWRSRLSVRVPGCQKLQMTT